MRWIDSLEMKYGRFAIHGVVRLIVIIQAGVFVLYLMEPRFVYLLYLQKDLVLHGEVWRLVSYMFVPRLTGSTLTPDYLWITFRLLFTWMLGDGLESVWGGFKLNIYLLIGMVGTIIAAFAFGGVFDSWLLYYSLLYGFATIDPNYPIFFFFFQMPIKWLALISTAFLVLGLLAAPLSQWMATVLALANYLIFFGPDTLKMLKHYNTVAGRRRRFETQLMRDDEAVHRCTVCNRTELSDPDLDFRVAADGHEYCVDHLPGKQDARNDTPQAH